MHGRVAALSEIGRKLSISRLTQKKRQRSEGKTDALSGLGNREAFMSLGSSALSGAPTGSVGVVVCEIAGLTEINDCCGRLVGDDVLRLAAHQVRLAAGENGAAFRIGGSEFGVVIDRSSGERLAGLVVALREFELTLAMLGHSHEARLPAGFASAEAGEGFGSLIKRANQRRRETETPGKSRALPSLPIAWPEPRLSTGQMALPAPGGLRLVTAIED